ncbi:hypothetical protein GCM10020331_088460 [Ectobacillus funiculus]
MNQSWLQLEKSSSNCYRRRIWNRLKKITENLVKNGARVIVADLSVSTGEQADGTYHIQCNVTNKQSVENMISQAVERFGTVDILVNNAGVNLPRLLVDFRGEKAGVRVK